MHFQASEIVIFWSTEVGKETNSEKNLIVIMVRFLPKIGDAQLVDTTGHEIDRYEGLFEASLWIVGCDLLVAVITDGYAAGSEE